MEYFCGVDLGFMGDWTSFRVFPESQAESLGAVTKPRSRPGVDMRKVATDGSRFFCDKKKVLVTAGDCLGRCFGRVCENCSWPGYFERRVRPKVDEAPLEDFVETLKSSVLQGVEEGVNGVVTERSVADQPKARLLEGFETYEPTTKVCECDVRKDVVFFRRDRLAFAAPVIREYSLDSFSHAVLSYNANERCVAVECLTEPCPMSLKMTRRKERYIQVSIAGFKKATGIEDHGYRKIKSVHAGDGGLILFIDLDDVPSDCPYG